MPGRAAVAPRDLIFTDDDNAELLMEHGSPVQPSSVWRCKWVETTHDDATAGLELERSGL